MRRSTLTSHRVRIHGATRHLAAHLDDTLDLPALARRAGLSPRQFERVFTRLLGESPRACQRRLRLERAAARLRSTPARILAVALEAGFESHEAFTRVFRQRFGHGPKEYRRLARATTQPSSRRALWQLVTAGALRRHVEREG
jgi:transcriptional regulator GlxA family with amidase domain